MNLCDTLNGYHLFTKYKKGEMCMNDKVVCNLVDRLNGMNGKRDYDVKDTIEDVLIYE